MRHVIALGVVSVLLVQAGFQVVKADELLMFAVIALTSLLLFAGFVLRRRQHSICPSATVLLLLWLSMICSGIVALKYWMDPALPASTGMLPILTWLIVVLLMLRPYRPVRIQDQRHESGALILVMAIYNLLLPLWWLMAGAPFLLVQELSVLLLSLWAWSSPVLVFLLVWSALRSSGWRGYRYPLQRLDHDMITLLLSIQMTPFFLAVEQLRG